MKIYWKISCSENFLMLGFDLFHYGSRNVNIINWSVQMRYNHKISIVFSKILSNLSTVYNSFQTQSNWNFSQWWIKISNYSQFIGPKPNKLHIHQFFRNKLEERVILSTSNQFFQTHRRSNAPNWKNKLVCRNIEFNAPTRGPFSFRCRKNWSLTVFRTKWWGILSER